MDNEERGQSNHCPRWLLLLRIPMAQHLVCDLLHLLSAVKMNAGLFDILLQKGWQCIKTLVYFLVGAGIGGIRHLIFLNHQVHRFHLQLYFLQFLGKKSL